MTDHTEELLNCPFCGGDSNADPSEQHSPGCYFIVLAGFKAATQKNADLSLAPALIKAWNRRATPAQEAQDHIADTGKMVEQEVRQEAVAGLEFAIVNRGPHRILEWHGDNGCRPASDEEIALWDALCTPQPGQDVRALVEALSDLTSAVRSINCSQRHAIMIKGDDEQCFYQRAEWVNYVLGLCTEAEKALAAHRQAQQGEQHEIQES